jgi:putative transcriptional regulator
MKKSKAIEFDAEALVRSAEGFAGHLTGKGKITLRTRTFPLPPRVKALTPTQVRAIRTKLNVSQPVFAALMNIPSVTAASWERGRRKPTGAALRLLDIAKRYPEVLMDGLTMGVNE